MKIRNGFVSNSSSSSFVIETKFISDDLLERARKKGSQGDGFDNWSIEKIGKYYKFDTWMDNFDMIEYLTKYNNVPKKAIIWDFNENMLD